MQTQAKTIRPMEQQVAARLGQVLEAHHRALPSTTQSEANSVWTIRLGWVKRQNLEEENWETRKDDWLRGFHGVQRCTDKGVRYALAGRISPLRVGATFSLRSR